LKAPASFGLIFVINQLTSPMVLLEDGSFIRMGQDAVTIIIICLNLILKLKSD
jgi:hypothetical protein